MNPLSNMFGNRSPAPQPQNNPMNNFMNTMQQFNQLSQMARMFQNRG